MTTTASLRRLVPVGWDGSVRALVDLLAARHAFEATSSQRDEIARRAASFLATATDDGDGRRGLELELSHAAWDVRADAAARLDEAPMSWELLGSLADDRPSGADRGDDARLASAIMVAARETLAPALRSAQEHMAGPARVALAHERDGGTAWDADALPVVRESARNARAHGYDRRRAALMTIAAVARLKGRTLAAGRGPGLFRLGAAAALALRADRSRPSEALETLVGHAGGLNAARSPLAGVDAETARLIGAVGACLAFGRGDLAMPRPQRASVRLSHVPEDWHGRFGRLTAASAAALLDEEASDPRLSAAARRRMETLCDLLHRHPAGHAVTFSDALGLEPAEPRYGTFRTGQRVFRAIHRGARPIVCRGRKGRTVRCHAVAGPDGAVAGYLAFDALSREFGGRPLYAAYGLDGRRWGFAWADEPALVREGEPVQGFRTAPAAIPA